MYPAFKKEALCMKYSVRGIGGRLFGHALSTPCSREAIAEEMRRMKAVGINDCIPESRPHPDWLEEGETLYRVIAARRAAARR